MSTTTDPQFTLPDPAAVRLDQPWRLIVAAVEVLVAAGLVWLAAWLWSRGMATITTVTADGRTLISTRYFGNWIAGALGGTLLAGALVVDALRQVVLALRTRPKRVKSAS